MNALSISGVDARLCFAFVQATIKKKKKKTSRKKKGKEKTTSSLLPQMDVIF
jgi:hypothetical protein